MPGGRVVFVLFFLSSLILSGFSYLLIVSQSFFLLFCSCWHLQCDDKMLYFSLLGFKFSLRSCEMKVRQIVEVKFASVYSGYSGLEITDIDGSEIKVSMTDADWKALKRSVDDKIESIERDHQKKFDKAVEDAVAERMTEENSDY